MNNNLFSLQKFIQELREDEEKKEMIEKYISLNGEIVGETQEQVWFKEYVSKFKPIKYNVPKESEEDFDWDLLIQLAASSFSSYSNIELTEEGLIDLCISVENNGKAIAKRVSELWGFQILRLYEIYVEEQMGFQINYQEDEKEKEEINSQRSYKLKRWENTLKQYDKLEIIRNTKNELDELNLFE